MRKITQKAIQCFYNGTTFKGSNTRTENHKLYLHNNLIARLENDGLYITNCGWSSNTTKERLNALQGVKINQKNFEWYLNGEKWDGDWIKVI